MSYDNHVTMADLANHGVSITRDFYAGITLDVIAGRMQCSRCTLNRFIKSRGLRREKARRGGGQWKWKPEYITILKQMWAEGKSATEVAHAIPQFTRNAVIGKCHRLKLTDHGPHKHVAKPRTKVQTLADNSLKMRAKRKLVSKPLKPIDLPRLVLVPESKHLTIFELTPHTCKWPFGDRPYTFCGRNPVDGYPYCEFHKGIAYREPEPRRWAA